MTDKNPHTGASITTPPTTDSYRDGFELIWGKKDSERGTGRTTEQIQRAPRGAVFVWCNGHLDYPQSLAFKLGRLDLRIVGPEWLEDAWRGCNLTGLVLDHAADLTRRQVDGWNAALTRVRPRP